MSTTSSLARKKIDRVIFFGVVPLLILLALAASLFSPSRFVMGDGYLFCPAGNAPLTQIRDPGGRVLVGPAAIRLWGAYPYVYGTSDDPACAKFVLNLKEHSMEKFPADIGEFHNYDAFDRFLGEHGFSLNDTVEWRDLYPADKSASAAERRKLLHDLLSCPAREKIL